MKTNHHTTTMEGKKMQESTHTPGPWILSTIEGEEDSLMVGGGDGSDVVADIRTDFDYKYGHQRVTANARIIAAAPDLLAQVKEYRQLLITLAMEGEETSLELEAVDQVIRKAEGEE